MGEDEVTVEVDRLLVVLLGLSEFSFNEVKLRPVVVDVGILRVLGQSRSEVLLSLLRGA